MMMKMNLFLVLAWVALIATVSVSASLRGRDLEAPDAAEHFEGELSLEEMEDMDLEEQEDRDLARRSRGGYGGYNTGYNGYGNGGYSSNSAGYGGYGSGYGSTSGYGSSGYGSGYGSSGYGTSSGYGRGNG